MPEYKVVLTGFGPFDGIVENSSTVAVLNLMDKWSNIRLSSQNSIDLIVMSNVEVSYESADEVASKIWNEIQPDLVIHVGVNAGADTIQIETQSKSGPYLKGDHEQPDSCINCICSELRLEEACKELEGLGFNCSLSSDPGCYICGYIYYRSLEKNPCRSVFIHVPLISKKFSPDYLGDFLLSVLSILCRQCSIPTPPVLLGYLSDTKMAPE